MKRKVVVKGERVKGSEFGIVDYKRSLSSDVVERRILNHNRKMERDYLRYEVKGLKGN